MPSMPGTSSAHRNNLLNLIGLCQRDEQRTSQKLCALALALWQYLVVSRLTLQVWSLLNGTHNSHLGLPLVFPLLPVVGSDTKVSSSEREGMCALWEIHAWLQRGDKSLYQRLSKGIQFTIREGSWGCVLSQTLTPWTVSCQAPHPWGFSRQEYWSRLPCSPPGVFPTQGSNLKVKVMSYSL